MKPGKWYQDAIHNGLIDDTQAGTNGPPRCVTYASEKDFQSAVVKLAKLHGWMVYHTFDSRRSEPGFPDLVLMRDGVMIVAELKLDSKVSDAQKEWLAAFGACNVPTYVWRPEDWTLIETLITITEDRTC